MIFNFQNKKAPPEDSAKIFMFSSNSIEIGEIVAVAIFFNDIIQIFVATPAEIDENRTGVHFLGAAHSVGNGVRTFQRGDNPFVAAELEESVDSLAVGCSFVLDAPKLLEETVFRTRARIVQPAGD